MGAMARRPAPAGEGEWRSLWIAALLFAVQITLMNIGFHHTSGAMGSVLIATNPLFAVMFAHFLVAGDRMTAGKALGLLVAMAGTSLALLGTRTSRPSTPARPATGSCCRAR